MDIIVAKQNRLDSVAEFYHNIIDSMRNAEFRPKWEKDIYPTKEFMQDSIANDELYVALIDGQIVGAMVINHKCEEGYNEAGWSVRADVANIAYLHILGVSTRCQRQGIAKKMVDYAVAICKNNGMRALRLDVLIENIPAQKLYSGMGFVYIDTIKLFYEDTGLTDFMLYELPL